MIAAEIETGLSVAAHAGNKHSTAEVTRMHGYGSHKGESAVGSRLCVF